MARNDFVRHFEDSRGVDYKVSDLSVDTAYFRNLQNYMFGEGYSMRGRPGVQMVGQAGKFAGIHTYTYFDEVTGKTVHELLALEKSLWRLKHTTLSPTRTGGSADWSWKVSYDTALSIYKFEIRQGGSYVDFGGGQLYYDLKTAAAGTFPGHADYISVLDLRDAIDGLANFSCAVPEKTARVNGAQFSNIITVDAGHTLTEGDWISGYNSVEDFIDFCRLYIVTATQYTAMTHHVTNGGALRVVDDQPIGAGAAPACSIMANDEFADNSTSPKTIPFAYWEPVGMSHEVGASIPSYHRDYFEPHWSSISNKLFRPAHFENADQSCFIFSEAPGEGSTTPHYVGYPVKYDGNRYYRAGVPACKGAITTAVAGGALTGEYGYLVRYGYKDNRKIINVGNDSNMYAAVDASPAAEDVTLTIPNLPFSMVANDIATVNGNQVGVTNIVVTAGHTFEKGDFLYVKNLASGQLVQKICQSTDATHVEVSGTIDVNNAQKIYRNANLGFFYGGGYAGANTTAQAYIRVLFDHSCRVGDTIYFYDRVTSRYVERKVNSISYVSAGIEDIGWDSSLYDDCTFNTADPFTINCFIEIWRTVAGGVNFYLVERIPPSVSAETTAYTDSTTDANLGEKLVEATVGKEYDIPPKAGIGTLHQGVMVYSRIEDQPNAVAFSIIPDAYAGYEAVPLASNYFDIPSVIDGAISAIIADNDDRLAIFKPRGYYDVPGDLPTNAFTVLAVAEGDYGISSQASLEKLGGTIVGVGPVGVVAVSGGALNPSFAKEINPILKGNRNLLFHRAVSALDTKNLLYRCYVPGVADGSPDSSNSKMYVLSYEEGKFAWFPWSYPIRSNPGGGMAVYAFDTIRGTSEEEDTEEVIHQLHDNLGVYEGFVYQELATQTPVENYIDHATAITYIMQTAVEHFGMPRLDKTFQELVLYSMYGDMDSDQFTAWDALVESFRNFQTSTQHTSKTLSFSAVTDFERDLNLFSGQARGMAFKITTNTIGQCPQLTGYEFVVATPYSEDRIRK